MRLLFEHDRAVCHWVAERIPYLRPRIPYFEPGMVLGPASAIGVLGHDGALVAGVVYHNYDPFCRVIEISCASEPRSGWLTREVARSLLRYPLGQLGCQRCTAVTPRKSTSTRRFLEGLGFRREGSARRGFGDDNAILYGLLAEDWAAHPINRPHRSRAAVADGQEILESAASA